jgi:hypothetical protein
LLRVQSLTKKESKMATPKQVVYTPVDVDDAEFSDFEHDPKMEAENAEFDAFKSEMHDSQDDAKITVGKKLTDSRGRPLGKQTFECFECGIDDYTFSQLCTRIREDFGTGLYMIQGRNSKGAYKFRKTVGILAPNQTDNPPAAGTDIGALIDKFSDAMQRQQMQTEQMFAKLAGPQTGGDAFGQMTAMVKAMGSIFGAIGLTPQQPKTLLDQLTEYKMMKELFGDGDGGGESNLFSLLTETVKSFGPALGMAIAAQKESGAIPMTGPVVAQLSPPQEEKQELSKQLEGMKPQIDFFIAQAKDGATPQNVVNAVFPGIPAEAYESIDAFLQQDNCVDLCAQVNAEVNTYRQWFTEWRELMLDKFDEVFSDETPPGDAEIIGPDPLTTEAEQAQTSDAVAGDLPDTSISATAEPNANASDVNESAAGDSGDTPNA